MKRIGRILLAAAVFGALWALPFRRTDVAELIPVQTVVVSHDGTAYRVDVGLGVIGTGASPKAALDRLREEVSGEIFFRTAEQVVLTESAAFGLSEVVGLSEFRPGAGVYLTPASEPDPEAVGKYLSAHSSNTTLTDVRAALLEGRQPQVPELVPVDGGYLVYA